MLNFYAILLFFSFAFPSLSCNLFKCIRIPTGNGTSGFWGWHIHNCVISVTRRVKQRSTWIFLAQYTPSPIHFSCPKRNKPLIRFLHKSFAKNDRMLWIKNILNKLLFLSYNSKWMNKLIKKKWRSQNFSFLSLKNLSSGQFLESSKSRKYHLILKLII